MPISQFAEIETAESDVEVLLTNDVSHAGHRVRLRRRYAANGLDGFSPHEVLELMLFRYIPRVDTNPIAHALIDRFGSLQGVFTASEAELFAIKGMTRRAAYALTTYRRLIPAVINGRDSIKYELKTASVLFPFARYYLRGEHPEEYAFLLLNKNNIFIDRIFFSPDRKQIFFNEVYNRLLNNEVSLVIMLRFCDDRPASSRRDADIADKFIDMFTTLSVFLIEVMVIGAKSFYSYRGAGDKSIIDFSRILEKTDIVNKLSNPAYDYDPLACYDPFG